jgi:hypothetical protein
VPLLLLPLILLATVVLVLLLVPVSLIQRYRNGTARRPARAWLALVNVAAIGFSVGMLLVTAAISGVWIPGAFSYSAAGLAVGSGVGVVGLRLTRWEHSPSGLHYTPNRWLVLALSIAIALRLGLGLWRAWRAWDADAGDGSWLANAGFSGSLAAGALVLGYYLTFWAGVWMRARRGKAGF